MATRVLDLELTDLPREIGGLGVYRAALALLRFQGTPVGRLQLRVSNGRIKGTDLREAISASFSTEMAIGWLNSLLPPEVSRRSITPSEPVTVAICTRERPDDLRKCLES